MENNTIKRQKTVDNLLIQKFAIKDDLSDISNFKEKEIFDKNKKINELQKDNNKIKIL